VNRSVVILKSKKAFHEWLRKALKDDPLHRTPEVYYPPIEESVWLVPSIGSFDSQEAFDKYLTALKPVLLGNEILRVLSDTADFDGPIDAVQFDAFFDLIFRVRVAHIECLEDEKE
jgi:hypothetical protein